MKKTLVIALIMLLSVVPSRLLAKGATTKVVIEGPGISRPIEITDRRILANFNVWAGPGTFSSQPGFNANAPSFIIDWSYGPITEVPNVSQKYQVSFYTKELSEGPIYVVYYAVARSSEPGYVYLPGESEEWWRLNVTSILRGVEGKWFHAWSTWENIARPLIKKARATNSTKSTSLPSLQDGGSSSHWKQSAARRLIAKSTGVFRLCGRHT